MILLEHLVRKSPPPSLIVAVLEHLETLILLFTYHYRRYVLVGTINLLTQPLPIAPTL